jgi:hypothetical protein
MKTTINIPNALLKSVMKRSGSKTIRGAVIAAMECYDRRGRQREVIPLLGTFKNLISQKELRESRQSRDRRLDERRRSLGKARAILGSFTNLMTLEELRGRPNRKGRPRRQPKI